MSLAFGLMGCAAKEEGCSWGFDEALEEVGVRLGEEEVNCGVTFVPATQGESDRVYDCLSSAPEGSAATASLQTCFDCFAVSILVVTADSEKLVVDLWSHRFDEQPPHGVRVTRCDSFTSQRGEIECEQPQELYDCVDRGPEAD